jgi:hypothetical protein
MDESSCIIHFTGKGGQIISLTTETLKKIIERRKQWLNLPEKYGEFSDVAEKTYAHIPANKDEVCEHDEKLGYQVSCYRNFTDKTKLERAESTLANLKRKKDDGEKQDDDPVPQKRTPTRQSCGIQKQSCSPTTSSSVRGNILPKMCLVCKKAKPISVFEPVSIVKHCFYLLL